MSVHSLHFGVQICFTFILNTADQLFWGSNVSYSWNQFLSDSFKINMSSVFCSRVTFGLRTNPTWFRVCHVVDERGEIALHWLPTAETCVWDYHSVRLSLLYDIVAYSRRRMSLDTDVLTFRLQLATLQNVQSHSMFEQITDNFLYAQGKVTKISRN